MVATGEAVPVMTPFITKFSVISAADLPGGFGGVCGAAGAGVTMGAGVEGAVGVAVGGFAGAVGVVVATAGGATLDSGAAFTVRAAAIMPEGLADGFVTGVVGWAFVVSVVSVVESVSSISDAMPSLGPAKCRRLPISIPSRNKLKHSVSA